MTLLQQQQKHYDLPLSQVIVKDRKGKIVVSKTINGAIWLADLQKVAISFGLTRPLAQEPVTHKKITARHLPMIGTVELYPRT